MSLISRDLARVLGSTAITLVLASSSAFSAEVIRSDGAVYSHHDGSVQDISGDNYTATSTGASTRAWGVLVYGDSTLNLSDSRIVTNGSKAHGVQVGQFGDSRATGNDQSIITLSDDVTIITYGNDSFGLHAVDGGTINSSADITTNGKNGFAAFAESGSTINLTNSDIVTSGEKAFGIIANNDLDTVGGKVTADTMKITTNGSQASGLYVDNGGVITSTDSTVLTVGYRAHGVEALSGGSVEITGGSIETRGVQARGIQALGAGTTVTATNVAITTTGGQANNSGAEGVRAGNEASVVINGGSITTSGDRAYGLIATNGATITSSANITTNGKVTHAVQAGGAGESGGGSTAATINLTGGTITVNADNGTSWASALHAVDQGLINANNITINSKSFGILSETASTVHIENSRITASGDKAAVVANNDLRKDGDANAVGGVVTVTNTDIITTGNNTRSGDIIATSAVGVLAEWGGAITVTNGSITTNGKYALAAYANNGGTLSLTGTTIHTLGERAYGAYAIDGGTASLKNLAITTEGHMAYGVYASGAGSELSAENVNITTSGTVGDAAWAYAGGVLNLNGGTYTVLGGQNPDAPNEAAHGLVSTGGYGSTAGGVINADNLVITTLGIKSTAILAGSDVGSKETFGTVNLKRSTVTTYGENAYAAKAMYGSTLTIADSILESRQSVGIGLKDNATVTLTNTTIISGKETFESDFEKAGQVQTLTLGQGTVATQNNGTLLRVERSEEGGDGIVNLTLQAGSVASGDIIDTDATKTTGFTNVSIQQGATYDGKIEGITDLTAESGTSLSFDEGTVIAGTLTGNNSVFTFHPSGAVIGKDLNLFSGSITRGGSIDTPIFVYGDVQVDLSSVLGGNWWIAGDLTSSGTITPGNSIGQVSISGDLTLDSTSVYKVEINAQGESDRIDVGGTANLAGTVTVTPLGGYLLDTPYTILTASDLAGTTFSGASFETALTFIEPSLSYEANNVLLTIDRNDVAFSSVAETGNQYATAEAIDSLSLQSSVASSVALLDAGNARQAFDQLSGDTHASVKTGLVDTANLTADTINNRLRSAFAGVAAKDSPVLSFAASPKGSAPQPFDALAPASHDYAIWASGFGSWTDHDGNANAGGLKTKTGGFLSGVDVGFSSGWRLGVVGGYSQTDLDAKGRPASANSDNWHLGIYGGNQWGPLGLRAGLIHTWHSIDSSRAVNYPGFSDSLDADYDARTLQLFGELGYRIDTSVAAFEPFANLSHVRLRTDGFVEQGGASALSVESETTNTTFSTLGLRLSAPVQLGATTANLKGTLGWRHAYGDITPQSTQYFAGGNAFTVEGVAIAKDAALLEAGFDVGITEAATFGVSYVGQFGSDTTQNGFNATLNVKF